MKDCNERRIQREADIAHAVRGPDYTLLEHDLKALRDEVFKRAAMSREHHQRQRDGHYQNPYAPKDQQGQIAPFHPDPTRGR